LNDYALLLADQTELAAKAVPRVGIVFHLDQPGGVQSVVLSLIKGLNNRGIIPDVIWDTSPNQDLLEEKGVRAGFCPVTLPAPSLNIRPQYAEERFITRMLAFLDETQKPTPVLLGSSQTAETQR
jgi:hypothetical protein